MQKYKNGLCKSRHLNQIRNKKINSNKVKRLNNKVKKRNLMRNK